MKKFLSKIFIFFLVCIFKHLSFSDKDMSILNVLPNVTKISLGKRILRTETAGIATVAMILYEYEL